MAFKLEKEKTKTTPYILIDEERKYMMFKGKSYLEEVVDFYGDVNDWLDRYFLSENAELTFDCDMKYFDSSTKKIICNMLHSMDKAASGGAKITVNWIVDETNEPMIENGEDFEEEMKHLTFKFIIK